MILSELWRLYEADKRIQGFRQSSLKAYALQLRCWDMKKHQPLKFMPSCVGNAGENFTGGTFSILNESRAV